MKWSLNDSNFTWLDRLKICKFFLTPGQFWTMTNKVEEYERKMRDYVGSKYAVFVSSGSTANTLIAMYTRDVLGTPMRNTVVFPSTTWITSITPFLREGFEPHFIDVNLTDLAIDLDKLDEYLTTSKDKVACVFITSLIGYTPNMARILEIQKKHGIRIMMDNCENTFGKYDDVNISSYLTSTTSTYFGHQTQSVEGGFVFTNSKEEYDFFLMARNHGMVRGLKDNHGRYRNYAVDSRFDFYIQGNNFRNTNIHAYIGILDFKRIEKYTEDRIRLFGRFFEQLKSTDIFTKPVRNNSTFDVPFCIPLFFMSKQKMKEAQYFCEENGIEYRPIISGNLLRQNCLKDWANPADFPSSEYLHTNAFYVGLHPKVDPSMIDILATFLNNLK